MHSNFPIGLAAELKVAAWYVAKGYELFWPATTQSRCDFVVKHPSEAGLFRKVQVKKATWSTAGPYKYLQCRLENRNRYASRYEEGDFDEIAFTDGEDRIWIANFKDVDGLVSVCLDGTKPGYVTRSTRYDPSKWLVTK